MIGRAIKLKLWGKWEISIGFFLLAILIAELSVILIINTGIGIALAQYLASVGKSAIQSLFRSWGWIYRMVGPMVYPLFILTFVEIWSICRLFKYWKTGIEGNKPETQYKILKIVEGVAPGFGFLGTCISLIFTMYNIDPNMTQSIMLKELLQNSSSAFGSTVYGITLSISAFLGLEIFKEFLFKK